MPSGAVIADDWGIKGGNRASSEAATGSGIRPKGEYGKTDRAPMPSGAVIADDWGIIVNQPPRPIGLSHGVAVLNDVFRKKWLLINYSVTGVKRISDSS